MQGILKILAGLTMAQPVSGMIILPMRVFEALLK